MIRIISGKHRGRKFSVPKGKGLRPTADRTRGAIFNLLMHRLPKPLSEMSILDAFAGSGALGLEAVSRGATSVTFLDTNPAAISHLEQLNPLFDHQLTIHRTDFYRFIEMDTSVFDLIFLDPPFMETDYAHLLHRLIVSPRMAAHTICVVEHPVETPFEIPREFAVRVDRAYGRSNILILEYEK